MLTFDKALETVLKSARPLDTERIDFGCALNRVLAQAKIAARETRMARRLKESNGRSGPLYHSDLQRVVADALHRECGHQDREVPILISHHLDVGTHGVVAVIVVPL